MDIGTRVQIPAYTDAWMRGARYGVVERIVNWSAQTTATVRLDRTGRTVTVDADDCTVVSA